MLIYVLLLYLLIGVPFDVDVPLVYVSLDRCIYCYCLIGVSIVVDVPLVDVPLLDNVPLVVDVHLFGVCLVSGCEVIGAAEETIWDVDAFAFAAAAAVDRRGQFLSR